jgi:hypothetical protein
MNNFYDNEDFMNEGWQSMSSLLDEHLPQKKKKKRALFFWLLPLLALSAIGAGVYYYNQKSTVQSSASQYVDNEYFRKNIGEELTTNKAENIENHSVANVENKITANIKRNENRVVARDEKTYSAKIKDNPIAIQNKIEAVVATNKMEDANIQSIENQTFINKNNNKIVLKNIFVPVLETPFVKNQRDFFTPKKQLDFAIFDLKKPNRKQSYQIGVFAFTNKDFDSQLRLKKPQLGFGAGVEWRKNIAKHHVAVSLAYEKNQKVTDAYYDIYSVNFQPVGSESLNRKIQAITYPVSCNCYDGDSLVASQQKYDDLNIIVTSRQFNLGIGYGYRFAPKWEASGTAIFSRQIKNQKVTAEYRKSFIEQNFFGPTANMASFDANLDVFEYQDINVLLKDNYAKSNIAGDNRYSADNVFAQNDFTLQIGVGYFWTKKFKTSLDFRKSFVDLTRTNKVNIAERKNFFQLSAIRYF